MMESLVIFNPRSRNILKSNTHKILCGLQTLGFMSEIRNSKTRNCFPLMFGFSASHLELDKGSLICCSEWVYHCTGIKCKHCRLHLGIWEIQIYIDRLQSTPSWLTFETHGNHKVSIHYF